MQQRFYTTKTRTRHFGSPIRPASKLALLGAEGVVTYSLVPIAFDLARSAAAFGGRLSSIIA
jgi:hypothetical protein